MTDDERHPGWNLFDTRRVYSNQFRPAVEKMDPLWKLLQQLEDERTGEPFFQCHPPPDSDTLMEHWNDKDAGRQQSTFDDIALTGELGNAVAEFATEARHNLVSVWALPHRWTSRMLPVLRQSFFNVLLFPGMRSELRAIKNDFNHGLESKTFDKAFNSCTKGSKYNFFYINREGPQPRYFKNLEQEFWPTSDGRSIAQKKSLPGLRAIRPDTELVPYWVSKGRLTQEAADIYFVEKAARDRPDVSHGAGNYFKPPQKYCNPHRRSNHSYR
jgi:hypothetical protein